MSEPSSPSPSDDAVATQPAGPASPADTGALDQAADSIDRARDSLAGVAANGDITTGDQEVSGTHSQDPTEAAVNADNISSGGDHDASLDPGDDKADPDAP